MRYRPETFLVSINFLILTYYKDKFTISHHTFFIQATPQKKLSKHHLFIILTIQDVPAVHVF